MSKERLEEIKNTEYNIMELSNTNMQADFNFLISYISGQVERVQELDEKLEASHKYTDSIRYAVDNLEDKNKKYREALEFLNEAASQDSRTSIGTDSHFVIEVTSHALEES